MPQEVAPVVDIVIPVFGGVQQTRRCLSSVLRTARALSDVEIIVIDDATPEPEILSLLNEVRSSGVMVLHNNTNLGFVKTANRGFSLHPSNDVILLNSDTEVANDWVQRLRKCAYRQTNIGTVTPFSNNATICSYPIPNRVNAIPAGYDVGELDELFRSANAGAYEDIPTAVGFCMYVRRACLNAVGLFDEVSFTRGYGEENDFSMRAEKLGWRNVVCADTFVFHEGHASFGRDRVDLQVNGMRALLAMHPDYGARIQDYIRRDPLTRYRLAVDKKRVAKNAAGFEHVIAEREEVIRDLSDADWLLKETRKELEAHRTALANGQREAAETVEGYQAALQNAEKFVREREHELEKLNLQLQQLNADYQSMIARAVQLEEENKVLAAKVESVINSRTWRYTRFLRRSPW